LNWPKPSRERDSRALGRQAINQANNAKRGAYTLPLPSVVDRCGTCRYSTEACCGAPTTNSLCHFTLPPPNRPLLSSLSSSPPPLPHLLPSAYSLPALPCPALPHFPLSTPLCRYYRSHYLLRVVTTIVTGPVVVAQLSRLLLIHHYERSRYSFRLVVSRGACCRRSVGLEETLECLDTPQTLLVQTQSGTLHWPSKRASERESITCGR
jgi:hypothetical protein